MACAAGWPIVAAMPQTPRPLRTGPASALNPEAGDHAVTTDPRELQAALGAGERTQQRFPYYERRYGERGRAFTRSDSAWVVSLAARPDGVVEQQLRWLGGVLSARGMPRWLLETHLETLHAELVVAVPDHRSSYDILLRVAATFREERFSHLDEATTAELAESFHTRLAPGADEGLSEAGALMVAAVSDERNGVHGAVGSLMDWLADPSRFSEAWVDAATETVATARALANG